MQNNSKIESFLEHPFVKNISGNPNWTVTDPLDKKPLDMRLLISSGKIAGASFANGNNPLTDLHTVIRWFSEQSLYPENTAYYLRAAEETQNGETVNAILDIEPKCPENLKKQMLASLPWEYAETSLSGKGIHLGFAVPDGSIASYQKLSMLKHTNGWYEILLNQKFCTFTMNQLGHAPPEKNEESILRLKSLVVPLYENWIRKLTERRETQASMSEPEIPEKDFIMRASSGIRFGRKPSEYGNDLSRYEFASACCVLHNIRLILFSSKLKDIEYSPEQIIWLVYERLGEMLPWRQKHDETRDGLPWLLYQAREAYSKMGNTKITI